MKRKIIRFLSFYLIISDDRPGGTVEYTLKSGVNSGLLATSSQYSEFVADGLRGYKQFMFNAFNSIMLDGYDNATMPDKYTYDFVTASNFFKAAGDIEDEVMEAVNEILNSPLKEPRVLKDTIFDGLISFNQFVDYAINEKLITEDMIKPLWAFCRMDLRAKSTGDIYWHGSEVSNRNDKCGYIEDFMGILEDFVEQ